MSQEQSGTNERFATQRRGDVLKADFLNQITRQIMRLAQTGRGTDVVVNSAGVFARDRLDPRAPLIGKTTIAHTKGNTEPVDIFSLSGKGGKGTEGHTGETLAVYNRYADVGEGCWVKVVKIDGGYELDNAEAC